MLPVLIVCYLRPQKLRNILEGLVGSTRAIYVFIDKAPDSHRELNDEVRKIANEYSAILNIKIESPLENLGVELGVPSGIDWAIRFENEIIIIEDDCLPTSYAYEYFDKVICKLEGEVVIACGTSPNTNLSNSSSHSLTLGSYPLIWGWCTTAENWKRLRVSIGGPPPHKRIFKFLIKYPSKLVSVCYFYSASIRIHRNRMKAWDSLVALEMILSQFKAIIPNQTLVSNSGFDHQAHHFFQTPETSGEVVSQAVEGPASESFDFSFVSMTETDKNIEKNIYKMKLRHSLSPIKALLWD